MRTVLVTAAAAIFLVGCAPMPSGSYVSPVEQASQRLRQSSMDQVALLSRETKTFLDGGKTEAEAIKQAQTAVADRLKDPGAAQFRNVRVVPYLEGKVICGEVNGKNSYGAYVGFRQFVASPASATTLSTGSKYKTTDDLANVGLRAACG